MRSSASRVLGVARTTSREKPYSSRPGSASSAVVRKPSEGTNSTVNGAAGPEGGGVAAGGEGVDVRPELARVHRDPLVAHRLVGGLHGLDVAGEGHLGVDDDLLAVGEGDHEVGAHARAGVVGAGGLLDEVAVLQQPGHLDHAAQLHLAPAPPDVRRPQRGDQGGGLVLQLRGGLADAAHLLAQLAVRGGAGALHAGEQPVQVVQRLVHRFEPGRLGPPPRRAARRPRGWRQWPAARRGGAR